MQFVEKYRISAGAYLRGILRPTSRSAALDPFAIKTLSKVSPWRILWTVQSRALQKLAKSSYARNIAAIRNLEIPHRLRERGAGIPGTAVTTFQRDLLLQALAACEPIEGRVAEIGSYRGVTTGALARATRKEVCAIDPFIGYGGAKGDFEAFLQASSGLANIRHIRKTSGDASGDFSPGSIALIFIDGVHDFSNSWFDYSAWSGKIARGGLMAFHDVDDHAGVTLTCRKICGDKDFKPWGYCPNLIIFERL
jgi:predicted O-methyltransferase YrrM